MSLSKAEALRNLPAVDELLRCDALAELAASSSHDRLVGWIRDAIQQVRNDILAGHACDELGLTPHIVQRVLQIQGSDQRQVIQHVVNATGIILHTNLGRSPLAALAVERMQNASAYTNLELQLESGKRSRRAQRVTELLAKLTGAEDAIVVNNCAGATMLTLQAVASGREVIISRGQLVEIGGGFRLPDVFRSAGVHLREVGTTNRTYLSDYESAIDASTGAILRVHHSNFTQIGFVTEPTVQELVRSHRPPQVPVIDDNGSGNMFDLSRFGLEEPNVIESVRVGADLCLFSGDKLFGGPQAGIIVGKQTWIERLRKNPLMRALRADKVTLAALEATTEIHLAGKAFEELPVLQMLSLSADCVRRHCVGVLEQLSNPAQARVEIISCQSQIGGGTLPGQTLASFGLAIKAERLEHFAYALRMGSRPILGRLHDSRLILDLRTVATTELGMLTHRLEELLGASATESVE
jgi:L-seryl-tRNA(Ser) seleniumtransferase